MLLLHDKHCFLLFSETLSYGRDFMGKKAIFHDTNTDVFVSKNIHKLSSKQI